jgi:hypothetical protein
MHSVTFFAYRRAYIDVRDDLITIYEDIGNCDAFIMQLDLSDIESTLAGYVGTKHAVV